MVIFRNPNIKRLKREVGSTFGIGTQIFKMESEASIKDLIDQQRGFFLSNIKNIHPEREIGLARTDI